MIENTVEKILVRHMSDIPTTNAKTKQTRALKLVSYFMAILAILISLMFLIAFLEKKYDLNFKAIMVGIMTNLEGMRM